jgi:hypothetical protein
MRNELIELLPWLTAKRKEPLGVATTSWLETETGSGDDPEELLADCVRIDLEMELLAEVTKVAWDEARPQTQKKKKR